MSDHDIVRVRVEQGDEIVTFNLGRARAKSQDVEVLDESPYDRGGNLKPTVRTRRRTGRPAKPQVSIAPAIEKKAALSADQPDTPSFEKE